MARIAIVTGGASGIGRALGMAMVERGGTVVLADVNGERAERVAAEATRRGPGKAVARACDVRDADQVRDVVEDTRDEHGRIDFLFNNAGLGIGGDAEELSLQHWQRAVDVMIMGVVHGVHAAYPIMIDQGGGHIVNTASLAGLIPGPFLAPYAMAKHAVVGLSRSLRAEAAGHGVRVTVVCPGVIETPILDSKGPDDLPRPTMIEHIATRDMLTRYFGQPYPASDLAEDILRGVARNDAVIVAPARARVAWRLDRAVPSLSGRASERMVGELRRELDELR